MCKRFTIIFALSGLFFLTSCLEGVIRFAYNNADYFVENEVEKLIELSSDQSDILSLGVSDFIDWHRKDELEPLASLLETINQKVNQATLTPEEITVITNQGLEIRDRVLKKFLKDTVTLLVNLTAEQMESLEKKLIERTKLKLGEDDKTFLQRSDAENEVYYLNERKALLENWLGELTPKQVEMLRDYPIYERTLFELRHQNRLLNTKKFIALIKQKSTEQELTDTLFNWVKHPEKMRTPTYHKKQSERVEKFYRSLIVWHQSLTSEQRTNLSEELIYYKNVIKNLK